ncbi:aminodeoxychorismate synthase component I [Salinispora oceanensis]|uniref:aminodeoxychorismate synthase component I n=1 Tax=Salinispora oceanensis TaxID=1050199 RepID=UPI00036EBC60|nr:aminodeoxychorismate synthase component I [Salinispora oceanensis]
MKTLIIDNYDSFTHNVAQYIAEVNGVEPVVIRNNEPGWDMGMLRQFDNVVISPGPGRPEQPADFGISAQVIAAAEMPLLGICLGHQGICDIFGGKVGAAPHVEHGTQWHLEHTGEDIFAGIPSPFTAVRYHSLAALELPPELVATAWTSDGVIMGLRHRERPIWGVQFHPESICTEHGKTLFRNFAYLTRRWRQANGLKASDDPATALRATQRDGSSAVHDEAPRQVLVRRCAAEVSAETVFDGIYSEAPYAFWLDSGNTGRRDERFSFMGSAGGPLARVASVDVWRNEVLIDSADGRTVHHGSFFQWLEEDLVSARVAVPSLPFDFTLGWVGYLGYELKAECDGERAHRSQHPDAVMVFADRMIVFDHAAAEIYLLALAGSADDASAIRWLDDTQDSLYRLEREQLRGLTPSPIEDLRATSQLRLRHSRQQYLELIGRCQAETIAGESYEICLTNMLTVADSLDPWNTYRILRRQNPVPFGALLRLGPLSVLSTSPERFLRISADGVAESKPIKGTRPRSIDPETDQRLREDLAHHPKDRAENLMIVDLVRNDLGINAEIGSVSVDPIFDVETFASVHQLVSTVRAQLLSGISAVACLRSAFPGGSMTGAPKVRTMQIIDGLEQGPRGVYSGTIGYFSLSGAADFSIAIRTLVISSNSAEFGVGGAIIALSDPASEFEETMVKATPLLRLLGQEFPGGSAVGDDSREQGRIDDGR